MRGRLLAGLSGLACILPCIVAVPLAHAAKLDREQRRTVRQADREADRFGASPKERLALFEALAVEARFRNPAGGDQDSIGSLQERNHYGSVSRRLNVKLATRRFLSEARAMRESGFRGSAGDLAAAVQRPREDLRGRYHEERSTALGVVNDYGGLRPGASRSSGGGSLGGQRAGGPAPGVSAFSPGDPAAANMSLAAAPPAPIASAPVAEPAFTARPVLPEGFQAAPSIGGPQPAPEPESILAAAGLSEDFSPGAPAQSGSGGGRGSGATPAAGGTRGRVKLRPGADRDGVPTSREVLDFLEQTSGIAGLPVSISTGSNHNQYTVSGNVSDHWRGMGADVPATGRRLIRLGQAALIAAGMPEKKARKQRGGLYNVGGRQIIFNTDGPNVGNHRDHLHVGL